MKIAERSAENTQNEKEKTMTTTTNTNEPMLTLDEMREKLAFEIGQARQRHETARAHFLAAAQQDAAHAVARWANEAVKAQNEYEVWQQVEREMAEHGMAAALANAVDACRYAVEAFFGHHSSCHFTNAVERARGEALLRLAADLRTLKSFGGF